MTLPDPSGAGGFIILTLVFYGCFLLLLVLFRRADKNPGKAPDDGIVPFARPPRHKAKNKRHKSGHGLLKNLRSGIKQSYWLPAVLILAFLAAKTFTPHETPPYSRAQSDNQKTSATQSDRRDREILTCRDPYIIDGDTLSCARVRIRLAGIDAPEMPGHCREGRRCVAGDPFAAKAHLHNISRGDVTCRPVDRDHYGRTIALCESDGVDFSCDMVRTGHAVKRYRPISC